MLKRRCGWVRLNGVWKRAGHHNYQYCFSDPDWVFASMKPKAALAKRFTLRPWWGLVCWESTIGLKWEWRVKKNTQAGRWNHNYYWPYFWSSAIFFHDHFIVPSHVWHQWKALLVLCRMMALFWLHQVQNSNKPTKGWLVNSVKDTLYCPIRGAMT